MIFRVKILVNFCFLVSEDALAGTVVIKLALTDGDGDIPSSIALYITSGNPLAQFSVRNTGEVYVSKSIDRELIDIYYLSITATDGKFVTSTKLTIKVLDVNGKFYITAIKINILQKTLALNTIFLQMNNLFV